MSLVAYGSSGESDSEEDAGDVAPVTKVSPHNKTQTDSVKLDTDRGRDDGSQSPVDSPGQTSLTGEIEDDMYDILEMSATQRGRLNLPAPKQQSDLETSESGVKNEMSANNHHISLPPPKPVSKSSRFMDEEELEEEVKPKSYKGEEIEKPAPAASKTRKPVRITIPELPEDDEEGPPSKKAKPAPTKGKSGLFALLPAPKHEATKVANRSLVPDSVSRKKPPPATTAKSAANQKPRTMSSAPPAQKPRKPLVAVDDSDEDDEEDEGGSYFSLEQPSSTSVSINSTASSLAGPSHMISGPASMDAPLDFSRGNTSQSQAGPSLISSSVGPQLPDSSAYGDVTQPGPSLPDTEAAHEGYLQYEQYEGVDVNPEQEEVNKMTQDEQFLRLQGKKQRGREAINIIDVSQDQQMEGVDLTKGLSEESDLQAQSELKKNMPSSQQRRKHQITYLAFRAKEQELELKNQWAQNRMTKRQTQSKYGF